MSRTSRLAIWALLVMPAVGSAQDVPAGPAVAPAQQAATSTFSYSPGGRRDPFIDLLGVGVQRQVVSRGEGAAGLTLNEISISGVVKSRGVLIAMIQGPDKRTYLVHPGDKLADGIVTSVTPQGIIVLQDVQDRFATRRQQEVRKLLKSLEGVQD